MVGRQPLELHIVVRSHAPEPGHRMTALAGNHCESVPGQRCLRERKVGVHAFTVQYLNTSWSVVIGKRAPLRTVWPKGREGSSPSSSTEFTALPCELRWGGSVRENKREVRNAISPVHQSLRGSLA